MRDVQNASVKAFGVDALEAMIGLRFRGLVDGQPYVLGVLIPHGASAKLIGESLLNFGQSILDFTEGRG